MIDPLYDMTTYLGRFSHFFRQQDPRNLFQNEDEAREILERFHSEKVVKKFRRVLECQICLRLVAPPSHW